jgi:threonine aldolase
LDEASLKAALVRINDPHYAPPGLLCLENTHNRCGGAVLTPAYMARVHGLARTTGVPLHLDGARVFNAAVALGIDVREITQHVDTVQFCLSKGLSAPVGSIVAGPREFVDKARRVRKMLGGGMRQAGVIAAAGMVALGEMIGRLAEDHTNAKFLAEGLQRVPGVKLDPARVQSDIVVFELAESRGEVANFLAALTARGVRMTGFGGRRVRAVTHYGISEDDCRRAIDVVSEVLR